MKIFFLLLVVLFIAVIVIASNTHASGYGLTQVCDNCGAQNVWNILRAMKGG